MPRGKCFFSEQPKSIICLRFVHGKSIFMRERKSVVSWFKLRMFVIPHFVLVVDIVVSRQSSHKRTNLIAFLLLSQIAERTRYCQPKVKTSMGCVHRRASHCVSSWNYFGGDIMLFSLSLSLLPFLGLHFVPFVCRTTKMRTDICRMVFFPPLVKNLV